MIIDTNILDKFNISVNEYRLCDLIARSQTHNGWCNKEKHELAKELQLSEIYIHRMLKRLKSIGLLEKHPMQIGVRRRLLRATELWHTEVAKMRQSIYTQLTHETL